MEFYFVSLFLCVYGDLVRTILISSLYVQGVALIVGNVSVSACGVSPIGFIKFFG